LTLARLAALTTAITSLDASTRYCFTPSLGLVMTATAPAPSASMVVCAPCSVSVEHITTGVGRSVMIFLKKVMPSIRGISTSSRTTSGHVTRMRCMAIKGSLAEPTTVMPGSALKSSVSTWRTTAESSTTSTLIILSLLPARPIHPRPGAVPRHRRFAGRA
jgi:hypothetical protein